MGLRLALNIHVTIIAQHWWLLSIKWPFTFRWQRLERHSVIIWLIQVTVPWVTATRPSIDLVALLILLWNGIAAPYHHLHLLESSLNPHVFKLHRRIDLVLRWVVLALVAETLATYQWFNRFVVVVHEAVLSRYLILVQIMWALMIWLILVLVSLLTWLTIFPPSEIFILVNFLEWFSNFLIHFDMYEEFY